MTLTTQQLTITLGTKTICRDVTLTINPSEKWGLLGPNGCGKTTLLHTLAGLHPPKQGDIFLNATNIKRLSATALAQTRAILLQDNQFIFPQRVWDYCLSARFPFRAYREKSHHDDEHIVTRALTAMALIEHAERNVLQLSGGEKRRLAIAAALAQTPQLYLLDEPTNHLDIRHQMQVLQHFQQQPAAVIMAVHDVNHAQQYCDHILLLFADGQVKQGHTADMLTEENLSALYDCPIRSIQHQHFFLPMGSDPI